MLATFPGVVKNLLSQIVLEFIALHRTLRISLRWIYTPHLFQIQEGDTEVFLRGFHSSVADTKLDGGPDYAIWRCVAGICYYSVYRLQGKQAGFPFVPIVFIVNVQRGKMPVSCLGSYLIRLSTCVWSDK